MIRPGDLVRVKSRAYHQIDGSTRCVYLLPRAMALVVELRVVPDGDDVLVVVQGHRRVLVAVQHADIHLQHVARMPANALASHALATSYWSIHLASVGYPVVGN